jgi:hypothetical protein
MSWQVTMTARAMEARAGAREVEDTVLLCRRKTKRPERWIAVLRGLS